FLLWRLSRMLTLKITLKARIKKLVKRCKPSISHHRAWGRKNAKSRPTKDDSAKLDAELDEDIEYMDTEEAVKEGRQNTVDTARPDVSTARQELSTAGPITPPTTTTIFNDEEMTVTNTLIKLKDNKAKGVAFKYSKGKDRPARSILTLKRLPTINPKDKANIARDEDIAGQLEVELQAEVKRERQKEEQASMNYIANLYDEVQARIDVDHELASLYMKEQELIADFVPIGSEEDEKRIRDVNKKSKEESGDKGVDNTKKRKARSKMKKDV
nr:hypothetical protein [Tanacetum cinerariifolium]